jgi:hypothetical protein
MKSTIFVIQRDDIGLENGLAEAEIMIKKEF